ncbi:helix-turn-helix domain-containing protein [Deinococcus wulumuqiensis]|uniref:Helix-turn-helix domain-containing protein n=1 Tax=Deinococcus wulumuqiensis TaxID=980427 RepID=A0A345IJ22_9DEIO|nr:helix-turn-helix transcriptional regulator [Deinococcus wulumuqiensis]AXG99694.1 helix-turn-helix domain-containing protein [Deinococcus wulumuqiensis]
MNLAHALEAVDDLRRLVNGDTAHPLAGIYAALIDRIATYEDATYPTPPTPPHVMLAHLLEAREMSQTALAERLGLNQSNVSRLVNGETTFTTDLIKQLSQIFGVRGEVFLG